ncbi:hypothetical protein [Clostridium beijerinckii]|nr:hypothetical protein [Clostridium beijerinckii]
MIKDFKISCNLKLALDVFIQLEMVEVTEGRVLSDGCSIVFDWTF